MSLIVSAHKHRKFSHFDKQSEKKRRKMFFNRLLFTKLSAQKPKVNSKDSENKIDFSFIQIFVYLFILKYILYKTHP